MTHTEQPTGSPVTTPRDACRARNVLCRVAFVLGALLVCLSAAAMAADAASTPAAIERVWSFNGGEVAVQAAPSGFIGTVVVPTRFAACTHPVGEAMWTDLKAQPDGSYWGFHRWFFETTPCTPQSQLGPTAWRVMGAADGGSFLLVCFGAPGGAQPTIAPDGSTTNVGYGCVRSAEVAPVAAVASFAQAVSLPENRRCLSRRSFQIHLHESRYDPFAAVSLRFAHRHLHVRRHGNVFAATIDLRGLPRGAFTLRIHIRTVLGHQIAGARTYHTCRPGPATKGRR